MEMKSMDELQRAGKDNMDVAMKSIGTMSTGFQAIATEIADYSKKSLEEQMAVMKELMSAKSPEKAMEIQSAYVKSAYEDFVARATKISQLYSDLARQCYAPIESAVGGKPLAK
jgi:phasin family protein